MLDAYTGHPLPERTVRLAKPLPGKVNQILFGPGPNELTVSSRGFPLHVIDLQTGSLSPAVGVSNEEQLIRTVMSAPSASGRRRMALIASGRVHAYLETNLKSRAGEPIRLRGPIGFASFDNQGARLLTWSGSWG